MQQLIAGPEAPAHIGFELCSLTLENAMRKFLWSAGVIMALSASIAHGKECNGVAFPDKAEVGGVALSLNGVGLHTATMLKIKAYVAALYVAKTSSDAKAILDANAPYVVILQVLRNVDASDIVKEWDEGFQKNAKEQMPALKDRMTKLNGWMADMKAGQKMTYTFKPGAGLVVDINGTVKGTIEGDDFARAFLSTLLGAGASDQDLKAALLGGPCS